MSLTEVLVALFILTLGVIGILTMFPLGAAQMARAVRDDRSALAAANADAYMRWYWQNYVVMGTVGGQPVTDASFIPVNSAASTCLFDNPAIYGGPLGPAGYNLPSLVQTNTNITNQILFPNAGQLSYPVVVDPMGWAAGRTMYFGESPYAPIPRCTLAAVQQQPSVNGLIPQAQLHNFPYRICSLADGLGYNDNGTPDGDLELRYNWLWVLQRPQYINEENEINASAKTNLNLLTANMTVVVFDRRPFGYPPPSVTGFEVVVPGVTITSGLTSVTFSQSATQNALDLKAGMWVMDATSTPASATIPIPIRQANFYRVVSVVTSGGQVTVEVQTPIAPPTGYAPLGYTYTGTLVFLTGVSGVFVRPQLTPY
jgi:hypothetical protein